MKPQKLSSFIETLPPIGQVPIAWDATGYTSNQFQEEVRRPAFDGWDGDLTAEEEAAAVVRLLQPQPGQTLLDVACGYGRHALLFAADYGLSVTGLDVSEGLLERARALAAEKGADVNYVQFHARDLDFADQFDFAAIIYNSFSLFSDQDAPEVLRRIHRALKPAGRLFLDLDNKPHYTRYGTCYRNWYLAGDRLTLQDVYYHHDLSVEVARDIFVDDGSVAGQFLCFKRIYAAGEITGLLASCGFRVLSLYGNWDFIPCSDAAPKLILTADKA